jgi:hypothetical protein
MVKVELIREYRINKPEEVEQIKKVFTNTLTKYNVTLKKGDIVINLHSVSKDAIRQFERDNYNVISEPVTRHEKKNTVMGLPANIEAIVNNNYNTGVRVDIAYIADDARQVCNLYEDIEAKLTAYLAENGVTILQICNKVCDLKRGANQNACFTNPGRRVEYAAYYARKTEKKEGV